MSASYGHAPAPQLPSTGHPVPPRTSTFAIVAFIAAFMIPVAGIVLGVLARRQLSAPGSTEDGAGLARWAVVVGIAGTVLQTLFFVVWLWFFVRAVAAHPPGV
ncbi:DUF4190 domain-containing protein [Cellulomonas septica]|uniref:DUF4190 domain-containing protein n=1 Tax=Cellulomonas septica TaxID=285080 RepID=A0ABX1JY99_9CELL|nr:DUF4190 domain-containing protein [Cellulomonas septica]NKY38196.1 DUF4190 domain-containing protein [Cellulomonas septica]